MPLQSLPLVGASYELVSRAGSAQRLCNMFAERLPEGGRSPFILKPTAGLTVAFECGTGPIKAMAQIPGATFVVSGTNFFRILADGSPPQDLGYIGINDQPTIALGPSQVVVVSPPYAYVTDYSSPALEQVTTGSGNFPSDGSSSVAFLDGYFVFTSFTGTYFFCSDLLSGLNFDSLDYAISTPRPDFATRVVEHNGELWMFGEKSTVVWYNAGAADFPFRERAGSVTQAGVASRSTICALDGSLFWLGRDGIVYRSQGYQAKRISTHAIEEQIARTGGILQSVAASFLKEGHAFYALTMTDTGDGGRTFVYDASIGEWHERSSGVGGVGRWNINAAVLFNERLVLGSSVDGTLFDYNLSFSTDNGVQEARIVTLPVITAHGPRAFMSRLEVEMEVGTGIIGTPASLYLDWSDDGGITWSAPRPLPVGGVGDTRKRVVATRLGSFRQRVLRLKADGRLTVYAVDADISAGAH